MATAMGPLERLRSTSRDALHRGIRYAEAESPPNVARQLARFDTWVRKQERALDQARKQREKRLANLETDIRKALAGGVRRLEALVRP